MSSHVFGPCRARGRRLRRPQCPRPAPPLPPRQLPPRQPAFQQPRPRWAPGLLLLLPSPPGFQGSAHALGGNGNLPLLRSHGRRLLKRRATLHLLRALPCLVQEALHVTGPAYDLRRRLRRARTGQHVQAHVLSRVLGQLRAESLRGCKPRGPCLSAVCSAAQAVRDGGRPLPVAGQGAGLGVSRQVVLNKAGSAVPLSSKEKLLIVT